MALKRFGTFQFKLTEGIWRRYAMEQFRHHRDSGLIDREAPGQDSLKYKRI